MAKDPSRRFSSAAVMTAALRSDPAETVSLGPAPTVAVVAPTAAMQATPAGDSAPGVGNRDRWLRRDHRPLLIVGAVVAALLIVVVLVAIRVGSSSTSPGQNSTLPGSGSVPAGIDEPLRRLEKAVLP